MTEIACDCVHVLSVETDEVTKPDELVIKDEKIYIRYSYPLRNPTFKEFAQDGGFTRIALLRAIAKGYAEIYEAEEASRSADSLPHQADDILLNRNRTNGIHGIWGHDLGDLYIEGIYYNSMTKLVTLSIGS